MRGEGWGGRGREVGELLKEGEDGSTREELGEMGGFF